MCWGHTGDEKLTNCGEKMSISEYNKKFIANGIKGLCEADLKLRGGEVSVGRWGICHEVSLHPV